LTILTSQFAGAGFESGGGGSNYVEVCSPTSPNKLFRLFGDSDSDGPVTALDLNAFRLAYGVTSLAFGFDNSDSVSVWNVAQFRNRFGSSVLSSFSLSSMGRGFIKMNSCIRRPRRIKCWPKKRTLLKFS
jgi:hypothetical protein